MKTFKQYFIIEENRRNFLKTLFGTAATAAVSNPVKIADAIAKKAGRPWLKVTLEGDFAIWGHEMVSPKVVGTLTQASVWDPVLKKKVDRKYIPGVTDDGVMMVDFNDSAIDMVQVYVKPGTDVYTKLKGSLEDEEYDLGNITAEFDKEVFKTMTGSDSSTQWYADQIESQMEKSIKDFEELPDWQKDERADVDGTDEESFPSEAQEYATDQAHRYLNLGAEDFEVEIPEEIKAVIERGYMKSYALGAGSGNEVVTTDSLEKLRELTGDEELEDPDEDDLYRWLDGEADGVHDKFRYSDDEALDHEDGRWNHAGYVDGEEDEYEQPPGTGADTSWDDGEGTKLSLADVLAYAEYYGEEESANDFKHLMIPTERDPARVQAADLQEPILIAYDGQEPIKILDGQHRLQKAMEVRDDYPMRVKKVDINKDPKLKQMFAPEKDHENI
jgi:hypothetical protein